MTLLVIPLCFVSAQNDNTVPKLPDVIPPSPQSYVFQQFKGFAPDLQPFDITFGRHFLYKCKLVYRFQKDYEIKPGTFNWSS